MIQHNKIHAVVILDALDEIPLLRDGKGDIDALVSFHSDIRTHRKFMRSYMLCDTKNERLSLISDWNNYIKLRNYEDFIPHFDSENRTLYNSLF